MVTVGATISVWLAGPAAAQRFDPATQSPVDHERWRNIVGERRRLDWGVSRALLAGSTTERDHAYSLSHSHGRAALASAPTPIRLGIDLETVRRRDVLALARFALPAQEREYLESLHETERLRHFYALWTTKEALAKALQLDLHMSLSRCVITPGVAGWTAAGPTDQPWSAQLFAPTESLILAVVWLDPPGCRDPDRTLLQFEWPDNARQQWQSIARIDGQAASGRPDLHQCKSAASAVTLVR